MNGDDQTYVGNVSHPDLGAEPVVGKIVITAWSLRFESEPATVEFPLSGLQFEPPNASEEPVGFQHPDFPDWWITASNADILSHRVFSRLTNLRSQLENVAARRDGWRRVKLTLVALAVFAVLSVSATWLGGHAIRHLVTRVPVAEEKKLGQKVLAEVKTKHKVIDDPKTLAQLNELTRRLVAAQPGEEYEYQITLLEDRDPNAFALPGGFLCVHQGLMRAAESPEELAGVMAHEMAHVRNRHGLRHLISGVGPFYLLELVFGSDDGLVGALAAGSQVLVALRFSREYEQEADDAAWEYLQAANIDPRGMSSFLKKLQVLEAKLGVSDGNRALSSHPPTPERIKRLEDKWQQTTKRDGFVKLPQLEKPPPSQDPRDSFFRRR